MPNLPKPFANDLKQMVYELFYDQNLQMALVREKVLSAFPDEEERLNLKCCYGIANRIRHNNGLPPKAIVPPKPTSTPKEMQPPKKVIVRTPVLDVQPVPETSFELIPEKDEKRFACFSELVNEEREFLQGLRQEGYTWTAIVDELKIKYPSMRGIYANMLSRFMKTTKVFETKGTRTIKITTPKGIVAEVPATDHIVDKLLKELLGV